MPATLFIPAEADDVATLTEDTPFHRALRWRVHDPEEAMGLAASHRRQAAEARMCIPASIDSFRDRSRAAYLQQRAADHEEIAAVCERHAAELARRHS